MLHKGSLSILCYNFQFWIVVQFVQFLDGLDQNWFLADLSDRTKYSDGLFDINRGVPQRSILGPLVLFLQITQTILFQLTSHPFLYGLYDDTIVTEI